MGFFFNTPEGEIRVDETKIALGVYALTVQIENETVSFSGTFGNNNCSYSFKLNSESFRSKGAETNSHVTEGISMLATAGEVLAEQSSTKGMAAAIAAIVSMLEKFPLGFAPFAKKERKHMLNAAYEAVSTALKEATEDNKPNS